jgi:ribosome recycling factor
MKIAIKTLIHEMESRLGGYVTLLVYRYANLCVKAQPMALLSAQIVDDEMGEMKIEQVAGVMMPDEYHLKLIPFDPRFNFPLCKAIKKEHPEFKQDLQKLEDGEENERILILTMPEVNKDRRDVLIDSVDMLYDGCKAKMEKTCADYRLKLEKKIITLPTDEERNEAKDALESSIKTHLGIIDTVKSDKVKEIEEAYQRYLNKQTAKKAETDETAAARGHQAGKQLRLDTDE